MLRPPELEQLGKFSHIEHLIGFDEVGRGALFGPVTVGAALLSKDSTSFSWAEEITDSKQLSAAKRDELAGLIQNNMAHGVKHVAVHHIDKYNINEAIRYAIYRLARQLIQTENLAIDKTLLLIDGNYRFTYPCLRMQEPMPDLVAIIEGDLKCFTIGCASIIAKVARDKMVDAASEHYQGFDLENNKGYGTPKHLAGLDKLGPTRRHRKSFTKTYWQNS